MDNNSIAIAALALAGTAVGGILWVVKWFAGTLSEDLREHTRAAVDQSIASREQTRASQEVLTFMKNLNGKLEKATIQKAAERNN